MIPQISDCPLPLLIIAAVRGYRDRPRRHAPISGQQQSPDPQNALDSRIALRFNTKTSCDSVRRAHWRAAPSVWPREAALHPLSNSDPDLGYHFCCRSPPSRHSAVIQKQKGHEDTDIARLRPSWPQLAALPTYPGRLCLAHLWNRLDFCTFLQRFFIVSALIPYLAKNININLISDLLL